MFKNPGLKGEKLRPRYSCWFSGNVFKIKLIKTASIKNIWPLSLFLSDFSCAFFHHSIMWPPDHVTTRSYDCVVKWLQYMCLLLFHKKQNWARIEALKHHCLNLVQLAPPSFIISKGFIIWNLFWLRARGRVQFCDGSSRARLLFAHFLCSLRSDWLRATVWTNPLCSAPSNKTSKLQKKLISTWVKRTRIRNVHLPLSKI